MLTDQQRAVFDFLRTEFNGEWQADFARLRQIPSTQVLRFLDYFAELPCDEQSALAADLAQNALCVFFPGQAHLLLPYTSGKAAYRRYVDTMALIWDWKYMGTRLLRSFLAEDRRSLTPSLPDEVRRQAEAIVPTSASAIRKAVRARFAELFGATATNLGGSNWRYEGHLQEVTLRVEIDYGGRSDQLRYWVSVYSPARRMILKHLSFEAMMGFPTQTSWDNLEQANLEPSITLLGELVTYCAELPARLPSAYTPG
jgi:hypothetical protein